MKRYSCDKKTNDKISCDIQKISDNGFKIKPKNNIKYEGIIVSELTIINPLLIENVLKRKTKRKLNAYLGFLVDSLEDDDATGEEMALILEDAVKYRMIIMQKYAKFLNKSYISELLLRVNFIEEELKMRIYNYQHTLNSYLGKGR